MTGRGYNCIMHLHINGETKIVQEVFTVAQLVDTLGLAQKKIAIEVNRQIIPSSNYAKTMLKENDTIEIIHAVGGG